MVRSCGLWGVVCTDQDWILFILSLACLALALLWEFSEGWRAREWPRALDPECRGAGDASVVAARDASSQDPAATDHVLEDCAVSGRRG